MNKAYIAIGGNLDFASRDLKTTIEASLCALRKLSHTPLKASQFYQTPAFPAGSGPDFINAAAEITTAHAPQKLLASLHEIERAYGRERHLRWAARTLDLDLIAYENKILPDAQTVSRWISASLKQQQSTAPSELILPHPRLQDRSFVLVPLADLAPDWRHPILKKTVREMLDALPASELATLHAI